MRIIIFYKNLFKEIKSWFIAVVLWFFVCSVIGFITFLFYPGFLENIVSIFQDKVGQAEGWYLFWAIFLNNTMVSLMAIGAGLIAGLVPALMVSFNGFLLGYIACAVLQQPGEGFFEKIVFIFGSLVPHGIIELPVIFLSATVGLRLGLNWVIQEIRINGGWTAFKKDLLLAVAVVPVIVIGLAAAAILEAFITSYIVDLLLL